MCIGLFKRICHWGPLIALAIIKAVTMSSVACLSQWWPPWTTWSGSLMFFSFMSSAVLTLYFFMQAMFTGPGVLPKLWHPEDDSAKENLQFCAICEGYKAPRAHHCRKCGTCNMKMDHHCPWINNCVGHKNHTAFVSFLFFAVVGCAQGTVILSSSIYRAIHRTYYLYYGNGNEPIVYMSLWGLVFNMFVLGLAIGVVIAVGMLLYFQVRGILRNRTGVEDWILDKAMYRRDEKDPPFTYPYDLGRWINFKQVINCACEPVGDGITWPVRDGCNQYTLTSEQIRQKEEKRARSREYITVKNYSGWWFPCTKGFCTFLHPPCTDEPRIQLTIGDSIIVTRWKRYWLYGERVQSNLENDSNNGSCPKSKAKNRHRGWFPRCSVVEVSNSSITRDRQQSPTPVDAATWVQPDSSAERSLKKRQQSPTPVDTATWVQPDSSAERSLKKKKNVSQDKGSDENRKDR